MKPLDKLSSTFLTKEDERVVKKYKDNPAIKKLINLHSIVQDITFKRQIVAMNKSMEIMEKALDEITKYIDENKESTATVVNSYTKDISTGAKVPDKHIDVPFMVGIYMEANNKLPERMRIITDDMFSITENMAKLMDSTSKLYVTETEVEDGLSYTDKQQRKK
jgi:hypothetical protein